MDGLLHEGILTWIVNQASVNKDPQIVLHDATKRMHEALLNSTTFLGHQELLTMIVPKSSSLRDALTNLRMTPSRVNEHVQAMLCWTRHMRRFMKKYGECVWKSQESVELEVLSETTRNQHFGIVDLIAQHAEGEACFEIKFAREQDHHHAQAILYGLADTKFTETFVVNYGRVSKATTGIETKLRGLIETELDSTKSLPTVPSIPACQRCRINHCESRAIEVLHRG